MRHGPVIHAMLTISFVAGLVPAVLLLLLYGLRSRWESSPEGRAFMRLFAVTAASYGVSVVVLVFPAWFMGNSNANWIRIGVRLFIAAVLWDLFRLVWKAQRESSKPVQNKSTKDVEK